VLGVNCVVWPAGVGVCCGFWVKCHFYGLNWTDGCVLLICWQWNCVIKLLMPLAVFICYFFYYWPNWNYTPNLSDAGWRV